MIIQKKILFFLVSLVLALLFLRANHLSVRAQTITPTITVTPTPDPTQTTSSISECSDNHISIADCPSFLQNKLTQLSGQEQTLNSQIAVMNGQIKLTQARIYATEQQISNVTLDIDTTSKKITSIQSSLDSLTNILLNRVVATYEVGTIQPMQMLLTSSTVSDFLKRLNYLKIAQAHDKRVVFDAVQAKNDYQNQKKIFEDKKKQIENLKAQLQAYTNDLNQQKASKQQLLADTQGNETTYQQLLSQAQAQLAGFSSFAQSQGGATLLSNQTICDNWGCYYNQRDSQWGGLAINHSSYSIAQAGCLMTSVAMVYTHFGHKDVTPISVNSNPSNFASYAPAFLMKTVNINGTSSTREGHYKSEIDSIIASGNPVIVGIQYASGDTHFVVLTNGSNGSYLMNDPFTPNGHNISFTSKYSLGSIFEVDKVIF